MAKRLIYTISINTDRILTLAVIAIFASFSCKQAGAQQPFDSIHQLKSVTISAERLNLYTHGMKIIEIDSATLENYHSDNAATLLASQTPVYVKSYGQGGLATLSIRGTSATQAGVYWNGININQPNIGMTDVSLVPLFFFESVALQYGGSSALFGSGNIGGGLHLNTTPHFASPLGVRISTGIGSFQEYLGNIKASCGGRNFSWSGGAAFQSQENDFQYTNLYHQKVKQENAALRNNNIIQQFDVKTSLYSTLSAGLWILNSERDLPSSMIASSSEEHQQDQSKRLYMKWEMIHARNILIIRSAFMDEKMHYTNPKALIDAHYHTSTALIEGEYRWQVGPKTLLGIAGSVSEDNAKIYAYSGDQQQVKGNVAATIRQSLPLPDWVTSFSIRKESVQGYIVPLCPSFGAELRLNQHFTSKLHIARNFRIPTLNDRFWQPGGNPNLKPETSWYAEEGINWQINNDVNNWKADIGITVYSSLISNLILWTPGDNSIWSPENIQEVLSEGLEFSSKFAIALGRFDIKFHSAYSYTPSTFNKDETGREPVKGKQLTYIPIHNAVVGIRIDYRTFFIDWEQSLTGKRFVINDNSEFLDSYTLGNLTAGSIFRFGRSKFGMQGEIRNLFGTDYQAIQYYAIPSRSFRLIINLIF